MWYKLYNPSVTAIYILGILGLCCFAPTRHRIWVLCGFYVVYGVLKIFALGEVISWRDLALFQGIYLILLASMIMRWWQDDMFLAQIRSWPKAYFAALGIMFVSALYSISGHLFTSGDVNGLAPKLTITALFLLAASQLQRTQDFKIFMAATVFASLALSLWVIWSAFTLDFEAMRGGIEINQNFVSVFVLAGAIPLVYLLFNARGWRLLGTVALLLVIALGSFILASRGMLAAFIVALIFMAPGLLRNKSKKAVVGLALALAAVFAVALMLPGGSSILGRFQEGDLGTLNGRTLVWNRAIDYFGDGSMMRQLFGYGLSSGQVILPSHLTDDLWNFHNQYLSWLVEQGFAGLIIFCAFLVSVWRLVLKSEHSLKPVMLGWLVFLMVAGLSSTIADIHAFWMLLGVVVGACTLEKISPEISNSPLTIPCPAT
jgi:O-antigen ligase